ncbi:UNVERIFIED_CONTAM: hypothetical protein Sindi_0536000 [Sesamum indicum]
MPQRPISSTSDRSSRRFHSRVHIVQHDGCLSRGNLSKAGEEDVQGFDQGHMEVYVDDMLVKRKLENNYLKHLESAFVIMRSYGIKLNPSKCTFMVREGKFMGYMVSEKGIEANPKKIKAIMQLGSLKSVKDVQRLTGKIVALNRFITRSAD